MIHSDDAFLSSAQLAQRWHLRPQTLANWRHAVKGPPYIRVGARVLYPIEGINAWEKLDSTWLDSDNVQSQSQST